MSDHYHPITKSVASFLRKNRRIIHMPQTPSRRSFVKTIVGTGIAVPAVMSTLQAQETKEKLRVAFIGVGGIGGTHLNEFSKEHFPNIEATALCDVDTARAAGGAKLWP